MASSVSQTSTQWMTSDQPWEVCKVDSHLRETHIRNLHGVPEITCLHHIRDELEELFRDLYNHSSKSGWLVDLLPVLRRRRSELRKAYALISSLRCDVMDAMAWKPSEVEMGRSKSLMEEQVVCPEVEMASGESLLEERVIYPEGTHEMDALALQFKYLTLKSRHVDPVKEKLEPSFLPDGDDTDGGGDEEEEEFDSDNSPMKEQVLSIGRPVKKILEPSFLPDVGDDEEEEELDSDNSPMKEQVLSIGRPVKEKLEPSFLPDGDDIDGGGDEVEEELDSDNSRMKEQVLSIGRPVKEKLEPSFLPDGDDTDGGGDKEEEELDRDNSPMKEQVLSIGRPVKQKLEPSFLPDGDDTDGGGDEEEEELDSDNSPMKEQVLSIGRLVKEKLEPSFLPHGDDTDGGGVEEEELDSDNSPMQEQLLSIGRPVKEKLEPSFLPDGDDTDGGGIEELEELGSDNSPMKEQVLSIVPKFELEIEEEAVFFPAYLNMSVKSIVEPVSSRLDVHDNEEMDRGKSDEQLTMEKEEMAAEEEDFACYRSDWESSWGSHGCGFFEDMTQVSSMHFTYLTPIRNSLCSGIMGTTWQIFSIKIAEIKGGFKWPLSVYGVVAARDAVDHNRNLLFCRNKRMSQKIEQDDPFLHLIGPSRAIVCIDPVEFEIQLKVQFGTFSQDKTLISGTHHYARRTPGVNIICFENCFCKIELSLEQVEETVQATLCSIRVLKQGSQIFQYGCRVACSTTLCSPEFSDGKATYTTNAPSGEVVLFNSHCPATSEGSEGYLDLDRRVVSVQLDGSLEVVIQAYSASGDISARGHLSFIPKACSLSQDILYVGDSQVEISVAWSLLVENKSDIAGDGWLFETSHLDD